MNQPTPANSLDREKEEILQFLENIRDDATAALGPEEAEGLGFREIEVAPKNPYKRKIFWRALKELRAEGKICRSGGFAWLK